jgi:hypothetical protein
MCTCCLLQLNRDLVGYFDSRRPQVALDAPDKPFDFAWPQPELLRAAGGSGNLMQLKGVSYTYSGAPAPVLHVSGAVCGVCCCYVATAAVATAILGLSQSSEGSRGNSSLTQLKGCRTSVQEHQHLYCM